MDEKDLERLTRVLQAHTLALCALLATHPDAPTLRQVLDSIADGTTADAETLAVLRRSIR